MSKELREAVLAKCGELAPCFLQEVDISSILCKASVCRPWKTTKHVWQIKMSGSTISLSEELPEDNPVWPLAAQILGLGNPAKFPVYDKAFEDTIFAWADENDDLGWATDGQHTFKSVANNALIRGAQYMYERLHTLSFPERPSNELIWLAFQKGAFWNSFDTPELSMEEAFGDFLLTIPADPLKADREFVAESIRIDLTRGTGCFGPFMQDSESYRALWRVLGMEVDNG